MIQKTFNRRVYITGILVLISACFFVYKLLSLHFSTKIFIKNPYDRKLDIRRGYIRDGKGNILAMSIERYSLFANPEEIDDPLYVAKRLSPLLKISKDRIALKVSRKKRFVWLKRKIPDELAGTIRSLKIKGLYFKKEYLRVYPHDRLAANLIGFVGIDNTGLEGIEYKYNTVLQGVSTDFPGEKKENFLIGNDIVLTIDKYIQYHTEKALSEAVKSSNARQGTAVVLEVKTGKILGLAKYPSYNPNEYYKSTAVERHNFALVDSYEPGSTMKIFSVAAIMNAKKYQKNKKFRCTGAVDIAGEIINCTGVHGDLTLEEAIEKSCNVGIMDGIKDVPKKTLHKTLKMFGFGKKLGVNLPGESSGILRDVDKWSGLSKYSISIGHEISITSLQLAAAYGAIGNGGIYLVPSIIQEIKGPNGIVQQEFFPESRGRIIDVKKRNILLKMLGRVVKSGTGKRAAVAKYAVAGKTGTAQKSMRQGGYYQGRDIISFAGLAPLNKPDVAVVVIIDEPEEETSGGRLAAPVFSKIVEKILPYRGINSKIIKSGKPLVKKESKPYDKKTLPDFKGKDISESIKLLIDIQKKYTVKYEFFGQGAVVKQLPEAGTDLNKINKVKLFLK